MARLALLPPLVSLLAFLLHAREARAGTDVDVDVKVDVDVRTDPVAVGEPTVVVTEAPAPTRRLLEGHRWEGSIAFDGMGEFGFHADDLNGSLVGLTFGFGRQLGALRVGVEYQVAKIYASRDLYTSDGWWDGWEDVNGEMQRYGATARIRAALDTPAYDPSMATGAFGVYGEAGAGRQQIAWNGGGSTTRTDLVLGAGVELAFGGRRMGGLDVGGRMIVTEAKNGTHDLAGLMHLGVLFGL